MHVIKKMYTSIWCGRVWQIPNGEYFVHANIEQAREVVYISERVVSGGMENG